MPQRRRNTAEQEEVQEEVLHPLMGINTRTKQFNDEAAKVQCIEFLLKISAQRCL